MPRPFLSCFLFALLVSAPLLAAQQSESEQPTFSLRAGTNLVVEDVVVTDSSGKPIHNLSASDFTILENGHPQTAKAFAEHSAGMPVC